MAATSNARSEVNPNDEVRNAANPVIGLGVVVEVVACDVVDVVDVEVDVGVVEAEVEIEEVDVGIVDVVVVV